MGLDFSGMQGSLRNYDQVMDRLIESGKDMSGGVRGLWTCGPCHEWYMAYVIVGAAGVGI